ncbi:MAG: gluconolactonase [Saprospiraceae bacterium]|jgi:gluconolactonase
MRLFCISTGFNIFIAFILVLFLSSCSKNYYSVIWSSPEQGWTSGVEGPATDSKGNVYAVNFKEQGTIGIISEEKKGQIFVRLPEGSIGNGIRFNESGNFYVVDYAKHNVLEVNIQTKEITVYAHDNQMNQPNDLAIAKNGQLFLSDPNWKESTGNIWRVDRDGSIHLLDSNMGTTNGIEVSPDENKLYVNESVQRNVWVYDLSSSGNISNKRLLRKFQDHGMDGMRCDVKGNLYVTRHGKGTVAILSPDGTLLEEVKLTGQNPTNITFGGSDGKKCYVTLADKGNIESFRSKIRGRETAWIR